MMKIFVVLCLIFGFVIVGLTLTLRIARNLLGVGKRVNYKQPRQDEEQIYKDVIYNKDDVIVMKGDAKRRE